MLLFEELVRKVLGKLLVAVLESFFRRRMYRVLLPLILYSPLLNWLESLSTASAMLCSSPSEAKTRRGNIQDW